MKHFSSFILGFLFSIGAMAAESGTHLQLRLKAPNGQYPTQSGITFNVRVLSASGGCILRDETFTNQTITEGNVSLVLGAGARDLHDPNLFFTQLYDNTTSKLNLTCVDDSNSVIAENQTYTPSLSDIRVLRISARIGSESIIADFSQRSVPYAYQAEALRGFNLSPDAPTAGQVLSFDGTQYKPITLVFPEIPEIPEPERVVLMGDVTGAVSQTTVARVGGKTASHISVVIDQVSSATENAVANSLVLRDASGNIKAASLLATNFSAQKISIFNSANSQKVQIKAADLFSDYSLTLPSGLGQNGDVLKTDASGNLSWVALPNLSGALMQTTFNGYVSQANCSTAQVMYWNSITSQFSCQNILLPNKMDNSAEAVIAALGFSPVSHAAVLLKDTFNTYVAHANCTSSQAMYWNSSTQSFACQAVSLVGLPSENSQVSVPIQKSPTAVGIANAYIVSYGLTTDSKITVNTLGDSVRFKISAANTGAATLKVANAPAAPLYSQFTGAAVQAGDLQAGYHQATYDGSNWVVAIPARRVSVTGLIINSDAVQTISATGVREGDSVHCSLTLATSPAVTAAHHWTTAVIPTVGSIQVVLNEEGKAANVTGITCTVQK